MSLRDAPPRAKPVRAMTRAAWAGLGLVALLWGGSFPSTRVAVAEVPVLSLVAVRVTGAALILMTVLAVLRVPLPRSPRIWGALIVQAVIGYILPFLMIAWGQKYITAGLASILNASTAVFGVLVAALLLRDERLTRQRAIGVGLGLAGVAVAMGIENLRSLDPTSLAQLSLVGASLCYAFANTWARSRLKDLDPRLMAATTLSLAALVLVPLALVQDGLPHQPLSTPTLLALIYLAVIATALAYLLYYRVLAQAGAGNASLVTLMVAPLSIVIGAVLLGEQLSVRDYVGFALLALGLLILDGRIRVTR